MNKTQLVDALAERLGDRRTAVAAVEGLLETIVDTVRSGETVTLTGFGVFEGRARAARTARNPRTGAAVAVAATTVPAFRPGAGFRAAVGGATRTNASTAPAPVAAAPTVEAPAKRVKGGGKAKDVAKDGKATNGKAKAKDRDKAGKPRKAKAKK